MYLKYILLSFIQNKSLNSAVKNNQIIDNSDKEKLIKLNQVNSFFTSFLKSSKICCSS